MTRTFVFISVIMLVLSSCIGSKGITKMIHEKYDTISDVSLENKQIQVINGTQSQTLVQVQKTKSVFVPAIFYWRSSRSFDITLDNSIPTRLIYKYANEYIVNNPSILKSNQSIEFQLKSVPKTFEFNQTNTTMIFILFAIDKYRNHVLPEKTAIEFEYTLTENGQKTERGTIRLDSKEFEDYSHKSNYYQAGNVQASYGENVSPKQFLKEYFYVYDENVRILSEILVDKVLRKN